MIRSGPRSPLPFKRRADGPRWIVVRKIFGQHDVKLTCAIYGPADTLLKLHCATLGEWSPARAALQTELRLCPDPEIQVA